MNENFINKEEQLGGKIINMDVEISKLPKGECAFHIDNKKTCFNNNFIKLLVDNFSKKEIKNNTNQQEKIYIDDISKIKKDFNCKTEACLLKQDKIINVVGNNIIQEQLERFKPEGPYKGSEWFSNFNIDQVLEQLSKKHKNFLHITFQMRDFANMNNSELVNTDFVKEYNNGYKYFGVVFNTDSSTGRGQHWYSVFGDFSKNPFTLEYFISSGEDPKNEIITWLYDL
jgi:hypothetical protein